MQILEPTSRVFVESLLKAGHKSPHELSLTEARDALRAMQRAAAARRPEVDVTDVKVPGSGDEIGVRIMRAKGASGVLPVVIYLHGGGWVRGGVDTHDRLARDLAVASGAAVAVVSYPLSPEAKYPRAVKDCFAAAMWLVENGASVEVDGSRLAIMGDGAGGNLAAAVTLLAKQRGGPLIARQVLAYPIVDAGFDTPSYKDCAAGPLLTPHVMKWYWSQYAPDAPTRLQAMAAPLRATAEQLKGLPTALVITADHDVLRDEGEAYARKLMDAGVEVVACRYIGTVHDFLMLDALAETPACRGAMRQIGAFLKAGLFAA